MLLGHVPFERKFVQQGVLPDTAFPHPQLHSGLNDQSESVTPNPRNPRVFQRNWAREDVRYLVLSVRAFIAYRTYSSLLQNIHKFLIGYVPNVHAVDRW
jgi:hypothetical protein